MTNRWSHRKVKKNIQDYIIPVIFSLIIVVMLISFLNWWNENKKPSTDVNNQLWVEVSINTESTKWYVTYVGGKKSELTETKNIFTWEKIEIQEWWNASLTLPNDSWSLKLKSMWELTYNWNNSFKLFASELWVDSSSAIDVEMRYATIKTNWASVFSLSQNEVSSTIYVLQWKVDVTTIAGNKWTVSAWNKISIMRTNSNNSDFKINEENIQEIDEYTKTNDEWFKLNNWNNYLNILENWENLEINEKIALNSESMIEFTNIKDEETISNWDFTIKWDIVNELAYRIEINWEEATLNSESKTFEQSLNLPNKVNDVVYKVYDWESNLIEKWVLTIYNWGWESSTSLWISTTNYEIKTDENFQIISPWANPLITSETNLRFEWYVPGWEISKITVNWFQLTKFVPSSTYWHYFANEATWNLSKWVNIYNVKYYWLDNKPAFENNIVVIKE